LKLDKGVLVLAQGDFQSSNELWRVKASGTLPPDERTG
jgi:hypothetical protein